ncbi:MAG: TolC family protein [Pseudomonadota bacterium]
MNHWIKYYIKAALILIPALASAGELLTLNEVLQMAETRSPMLGSQTAALKNAQAAEQTAGAYPNPEIEWAAGKFRLQNPRPGAAPSHTELISVAQPIEWIGVRHARIKMAQENSNASAAQLSQVKNELRTKVKLAYFDLLRRQEEVGVSSEMLVLLEQIRDRVKLKVEVGEAPRYELIKAEAETLSARNASQSARLRVQQARAVLRSLIGVELPREFQIAPANIEMGELPPLESLRRELHDNHPQLRAATADMEKANARLALERNLRVPQPTLKWTSQRDPEMRQWLLGVTLPLPLWNRREGQIGEASALVEQSQAEKQRQEALLQGELEQAYSRYQIARSQIETFETALLKEAEAALKTAEAAYRYGERNILDYLDAQRTHRTVRLDFLSARYELQAAWLDIERLRANIPAGEHHAE